MRGVALALLAFTLANVALAFILAIPARRSREEERSYQAWRQGGRA